DDRRSFFGPRSPRGARNADRRLPGRRKPRRVVCATFALVAMVATAAASPTQDLERARQSFRQHDYDSAMKLATFLLYPDEKLALPADLVEAHVILGA